LKTAIKSLPIGVIRRDGGTQMRAEINMLVVAEYAEAYREGADMPVPMVFQDGSDYWLADGFHRLLGAEKAGLSEVACEVHPGSRRDAILHACGANATHGLQRTNADKRLAVEALLRDEEWRKWSDSEIARRCGVSHPFVGNVRETLKLTCNDFKSDEVRKGADGRTYNTSNIGKKKPIAPQPGDGNGTAAKPLSGQTSMFSPDPPDDEEGDKPEEEDIDEEDSEEEETEEEGPEEQTPPQQKRPSRSPAPDPTPVQKEGFDRLWKDINGFLCSLPRRGGIVALMKNMGFSKRQIEKTYCDFADMRKQMDRCTQELEEAYPWLVNP
jgi:hypothetical protein